MDGNFFVLSLADGSEMWKYNTEHSFTGTLAVRDGRCSVGDTDGKFYCFEAATGKPLWGFEASGRDQLRRRISIKTTCCSARKTPRSIA